jgi:hypothetical protein
MFFTPLLALLAIAGCGRSVQFELTPKFTRSSQLLDSKDAGTLSAENFQKIETGMTQNEVRLIFGTKGPIVQSPKPEEEYELVWQAAEKEISVRFLGDKSIAKSEKGVIAKESP